MSPDFLIRSFLQLIKIGNDNLKLEFIKYKDGKNIKYEVICYPKNEDKIYVLNNEQEIKKL